jgi:hypothetical protein
MERVIYAMSNDLSIIKKDIDVKNEIDINLIIKTMAAYSQKDLCLFRDCIDFMLIYNNR